ncbi:MAG: glutathione S-transferase N-terminal domain-containing protein [Burkholderiaceae bacterium]
MKFYYANNSCALASHIALLEAGAEFEAHRLDFAQGQQRSDDYLKINPKGRVPALATARGVLTETPAILAYIAQTHPDQDLALMSDPFDYARVQSINSYLCSTVHVAHAHKQRGARWTDDPDAQAALTRHVPTTMRACFDLIEASMVQGPWVMGEHYTVCDPYLFTITRWLAGDQVDVADFPRVHRHMQRMQERPAVKQALALHN